MGYKNQLKLILEGELLKIPRVLWGGFFPIHVSIWRLIHFYQQSNFDEVLVVKDTLRSEVPTRLTICGEDYVLERFPACLPSDWDTEGYRLGGRGVDQFNYVVWEVEDIIEKIEELARFLSDHTISQLSSEGYVKKECLPRLESAFVDSLSVRCLEEFAIFS